MDVATITMNINQCLVNAQVLLLLNVVLVIKSKILGSFLNF